MAKNPSSPTIIETRISVTIISRDNHGGGVTHKDEAVLSTSNVKLIGQVAAGMAVKMAALAKSREF